MKEPSPPGLVYEIGAGLQIQVVGVREDRLGAQGREHFRDERFHIGFRSDRDERWGADIAVGGVEDTSAAKSGPGVQTGAQLEAAVESRKPRA